MNILFSQNQEKVVLFMLLSGAIIAAVYDIFKIKRIILPANDIIIFFDDIAFSILAAFITVFSVFAANNGELRWYEFASLAAGFVLYRISISRIVIYIALLVTKAVKDILLFMLRPVAAQLCCIKVLFYKRRHMQKIFRFIDHSNKEVSK